MFSQLLRKLNLLHRTTNAHTKYCTKLTSTNNESNNAITQNDGHECVLIHPLEEILNNIPPDSRALSPRDTLNIFRKLSETSQRLNTSATSFKVFEHEKFKIIRQAIALSTPYLTPVDKFEVLRGSQTLAIPIQDDVFNGIIRSLLDNVFNMSLDDILAYDGFLARQEKTNLTAQLQKRLINRFNTKIGQYPVDFSYFAKTKRILQFIIRNRNDIVEQVFENMRNCLVKNDIDILTAEEATHIIVLLTNFSEKSEYFDRLKEKAFKAWQSNEVTIEMVERTLSYIVRRNSSAIFNLYNDDRYLDKCVEVAIKSEKFREKCFAIQGQFNYMGFTNSKLIDFLLNDLKSKDGNVKNAVHNCITVFIACDIANYKPPLFQQILAPALANLPFHKHVNEKLDWAHLALRLNSNGIYHKHLINEILKRRSNFQFHADSLVELESLELEKLGAQIVSLSEIKLIFGENIRSLVHTDNGVVIPLLVKIDTNSKIFVPFEKTETDLLNSMQCNDDQCLVAIVSSNAPDVKFQHTNLVTIPVNSLDWSKLLQHRTKEKIFAEIFEPTTKNVLQ